MNPGKSTYVAILCFPTHCTDTPFCQVLTIYYTKSGIYSLMWLDVPRSSWVAAIREMFCAQVNGSPSATCRNGYRSGILKTESQKGAKFSNPSVTSAFIRSQIRRQINRIEFGGLSLPEVRGQVVLPSFQALQGHSSETSLRKNCRLFAVEREIGWESFRWAQCRIWEMSRCNLLLLFGMRIWTSDTTLSKSQEYAEIWNIYSCAPTITKFAERRWKSYVIVIKYIFSYAAIALYARYSEEA